MGDLRAAAVLLFLLSMPEAPKPAIFPDISTIVGLLIGHVLLTFVMKNTHFIGRIPDTVCINMQSYE